MKFEPSPSSARLWPNHRTYILHNCHGFPGERNLNSDHLSMETLKYPWIFLYSSYRFSSYSWRPAGLKINLGLKTPWPSSWVITTSEDSGYSRHAVLLYPFLFSPVKTLQPGSDLFFFCVSSLFFLVVFFFSH
jgi:hypothetical protein